MSTKRQSNDFINFVIDAEKNPDLTHQFLSKKTAKQLHSFFDEKGYKDISYHHCEHILTAKKLMRGRIIPGRGKDCVGGRKDY